MVAVKRQSTAIAHAVMAAGANPDLKDKSGRAAFVHAIR